MGTQGRADRRIVKMCWVQTERPERVLRPFALSSRRASAGSPTAGGRWLGAVVEAKEQRWLGAGFGTGHQLRLLCVVQRRELAGELHILLELGNRIAADDHGADGPRQR